MVDYSAQLNSNWPAEAKKYKLDTPIGMGSFGLVWRAFVLNGNAPDTNREVAIKIIDLAQFQDSSIQDVRKEVSIMSTCQHKNVVCQHISFIQGNDLWIVMPILGAGSCENVLKTNFGKGITDEAIIATILKETLLGLSYFHQNNQVHRDIKAGNILLDMKGNVYLSDFGVSAKLKKGQKRGTFVGSPCWMAPEVAEQTGHDFSADIWSLGITAIELAMGQPPYQQMTPMKVIVTILSKDPPELPPTKQWHPDFIAFVKSCLRKNPSERKTAKQLLSAHKEFFDLAKDPQYLAQNFIGNLVPVYQRISQSLIAQGQAYLQKLEQLNANKRKSQRNNLDWDFGDNTSNQQNNNQQSNKPTQNTHMKSKQLADDDLFDGLEEDDY